MEAEAPIYIIGRQHSGNTMLATVLSQHPDLYAYKGEGNFFEQLPAFDTVNDRRQRIKAVVEEIGRAADPSLDEPTKSEIRSFIRQEAREGVSLIDQYISGKSYLLRNAEAKRWVQKATSYVFHVPTIKEHLPWAQFLFMARNPMDLAASKKKRGSKEKWVRTLWGWREGMERALELEADMPERFHVVRYEDLVRKPEETVREICSFCRIRYRGACLDIPHVNRSETPYNRESETKGMRDDRVFYFTRHLSNEEVSALRTLVGSEILEELYADLPSVGDGARHQEVIELARILGRGWFHLLADQGRLFLTEPRRAWNRVKRRILE
jgi:hypothetical protein